MATTTTRKLILKFLCLSSIIRTASVLLIWNNKWINHAVLTEKGKQQRALMHLPAFSARRIDYMHYSQTQEKATNITWNKTEIFALITWKLMLICWEKSAVKLVQIRSGSPSWVWLQHLYKTGPVLFLVLKFWVSGTFLLGSMLISSSSRLCKWIWLRLLSHVTCYQIWTDTA